LKSLQWITLWHEESLVELRTIQEVCKRIEATHKDDQIMHMMVNHVRHLKMKKRKPAKYEVQLLVDDNLC
jgi:hypothetical protein